jgi:putative membrane-bound dehydrogenase-like protein
VWVGAAPELLFFPDKNGDDKADGEPEVLLDGWGYQDTHETLNTFRWGPDGWLYGCHGVFTHSKVGKPGTPDKERAGINAGYWRYHPQRHEFEVFGEGTSNPWGIDFDEHGQLFAEACVIPHLFHVIQGARYERQGGEHFNKNTYNDIKTIADHRHYLGPNPHGGNNKSDAAGGGHAHAGFVIPQANGAFGEWEGRLLMNNIHGQRINADIAVKQGSGFVGKHAPDFINFNDRASQIVDLREGPDGTLFMIDWYDLNQCHRVQREAHDYTTGRIYRVAKKGAVMAKPDLTKASDAELFKIAVHGDEWPSRHARRILQERKLDSAKLGALEEEFCGPKAKLGDNRDQALLRALWVRAGSVGMPDEKLETSPAETVAKFPGQTLAWVARVTTEDGKISDGVAKLFCALAQQHPSPITRLGLASACQKISIEQRKPILAALLAHGEDATDQNLPLMYWYAAEPVVGADATWAAEMLAACKIPLVNEFIARRLAE